MEHIDEFLYTTVAILIFVFSVTLTVTMLQKTDTVNGNVSKQIEYKNAAGTDLEKENEMIVISKGDLISTLSNPEKGIVYIINGQKLAIASSVSVSGVIDLEPIFTCGDITKLTMYVKHPFYKKEITDFYSDGSVKCITYTNL